MTQHKNKNTNKSKRQRTNQNFKDAGDASHQQLHIEKLNDGKKLIETNSKERHSYEKWQFWINIILAFATGINLWLTYQQKKISERATTISERAVIVSQEANKISKDQFEIENQSYVQIINPTLSYLEETKNFELKFDISNVTNQTIRTDSIQVSYFISFGRDVNIQSLREKNKNDENPNWLYYNVFITQHAPALIIQNDTSFQIYGKLFEDLVKGNNHFGVRMGVQYTDMVTGRKFLSRNIIVMQLDEKNYRSCATYTPIYTQNSMIKPS